MLFSSLIISSGACIPFEHSLLKRVPLVASAGNPPPEKEIPLLSGFQRYRSDRHGFEMQYPIHWRLVGESRSVRFKEESTAYTTNRFGQSIPIGGSVAIDSIAINVPPNIFIESMMKNWLARINSAEKGSTLPDDIVVEKEFSITQYPAYSVSARMPNPEEETEQDVKLVSFRTNGKIWLISLSTHPSLTHRETPLFTQMLTTLRITDPNAPPSLKTTS